MYLPMGVLFSQGDIYRDFGFNNFPNLAILLHLVFATIGGTDYLTLGRGLIFSGWLLAIGAIGLLAFRATRSVPAAAASMLLLMTNQDLLGPAGMTVTNNFLPIPFALLGTWFFISAADRPDPRAGMFFLSGFSLAVAIGFKVNYVFLVPPFAVAVLIIHPVIGWRARLLTMGLPMLVGGIVGLLPVLSHLAHDPDGFLAHTIRYHRGPHIAYWMANPDLFGTKITSLPDKLRLAAKVWFSGGSGILITAAMAYCAILSARGGRWRELVRWPIILVLSLTLCLGLISFLPTPAFPQYYVPPIPFAILLLALLYGRCMGREHGATHFIVPSLVALAILLGTPRLLASLPSIADPSRWTGQRVLDQSRTIAHRLAAGGRSPALATLAPIYALAGGMSVYPELAAGPLVYRVGDLIPAGDRIHYTHLASPTTIGRVMAAHPPDGILVGYEGPLDAPFAEYARTNRYREVLLPELRDRYGVGRLFLKR